jgi:hypothetical protein
MSSMLMFAGDSGRCSATGEWEMVSLFGCLRAELFAGVVSLDGGRWQGRL